MIEYLNFPTQDRSPFNSIDVNTLPKHKIFFSDLFRANKDPNIKLEDMDSLMESGRSGNVNKLM